MSTRKSCFVRDFLSTEATIPAGQFLTELKAKHCVEDAEFLVNGMGNFTSLAQIDFSTCSN